MFTTLSQLLSQVEQRDAIIKTKLDVIYDEFKKFAVDTENPTHVTKTTIGLDKVNNYRMASPAVAKLGKSNTHYMSPFTTTKAIEKHFDELKNMVDNINNQIV